MKKALLISMAALLPLSLSAQKADTTVKVASKPLYPSVATLREEVSIGEVDGEEEYLFGQVSEIAAAPDGSIYVFDSQVPALRKYDAKGKYVRTLGRKGQGPGEYLSGGGLAVGPDGKVYLWDTGTWRINVYAPSGEYVESFATPNTLGANVRVRMQRSLVLDHQGALYYRASLRSGPGAFDARTVWFKMKNGVVTDTLEIPKAGPGAPQLVASVKTSTTSAESRADLPFAPRPLEQLSPLGYFITSYPSRYAFEIPQGNRLLSVRREVKPEPVTSSERAQAKKEIEERMRRTQPNWSWNGPDIPKTKSAFDAINVGADGRIWIPLVRQPPGSGGSFSQTNFTGGRSSANTGTPRREPTQPRPKPLPGLFDVFEPSGTYLGQVRVPAGVTLLYRKGDFAWGTALDEFDVATVKRFRIVWR